MRKVSYKMTLSKEESLKMERAARRKADIELQTPHFSHKAHKTKKDYNRNEMKRQMRNLEW